MRLRRQPQPAPTLPSDLEPLNVQQFEAYMALIEGGARPNELSAWSALRRISDPNDVAALLSVLHRWTLEDVTPEEQKQFADAYRAVVAWVAEDQGRLQRTLRSVDEMLMDDQGFPFSEEEQAILTPIALDLVREAGPLVAAAILRQSPERGPANSVFSEEVLETAVRRADQETRQAVLADDLAPLAQRVAAARSFEEPEALGPYLTAQSPRELVCAVLERPIAHDEARVFEVALTHPDEAARAAAAGRLGHEGNALHLALSDDASEVVVAAIGALKEQASLLEVVSKRTHTYAPQAIARLEDRDVLTRLAKDSPTVEGRRAALERGRGLYGADWSPYRPQLSDVAEPAVETPGGPRIEPSIEPGGHDLTT